MGMLLAFVRAPQKMHFEIPPWLFFAMWLGFLGLAVLALYAKSREAKQRRAELEQFGMESGFLFLEKPDDALAAHLAGIHFNVTRLEYTPHYGNVLRGNAGGGDAVIADRTVGAGKSRSVTTIVAFDMKTPLPAFMVCVENVLWRLADKVGYSDIDIAGAPDFSKRFYLHGKDEAAVRALFTPEVTQAFEQLDTKLQFQVSVSGPWLVVYRPGRLIPAPELRDFLQPAESLANAFRRARSTGVFG
ncbi:MAG: hypothetical protein WCC59_00715 [Terriglobales bacterium]